MSGTDAALRSVLTRDLLETLIRVGLIVLLVVLCAQIFAPFMTLFIWALILAVALRPIHGRLARGFGGRQGLAAIALVLAVLLLLGVPVVILGASFASQLHEAYSTFRGSPVLPPPGPGIADWPIIGPRIHGAWSAAATNLPAFLQENEVLIRDTTRRILSIATGTLGSVALFLAATIVAGAMMAYTEAGTRALRRVFVRVTDPQRGPRLQALATATVRSVATGVIGVAFIQAVLLGMGFLLAGIPAAGVLAMLALLLGILQLPALILSLPAIVWLWSVEGGSTALAAFWTVYLLLASLADNVLKPMLLGRGVEVPMLVILIGALGGMLSSGIMGMFVGAVLLGVGYQLFMEWVDAAPADAAAAAPTGTVREG